MRLPSLRQTSSGRASPAGTDTANGACGTGANSSATLAQAAAGDGGGIVLAAVAGLRIGLSLLAGSWSDRDMRVPAPGRDSRTPSASNCRSEEHKSELQYLMRISYAVF